jgi:hypothetical protein
MNKRRALAMIYDAGPWLHERPENEILFLAPIIDGHSDAGQVAELFGPNRRGSEMAVCNQDTFYIPGAATCPKKRNIYIRIFPFGLWLLIAHDFLHRNGRNIFI